MPAVGTSWVDGIRALRVDVVQSVMSASLSIQPDVTTISGSRVGLLVGGVDLSQTNPLPVQVIGAGSTVTGSVGITEAIAVKNVVSVTGSIGHTEAMAIKGQVNVQGNVTASVNGTVIHSSGSVTGLLLGGVAVSSTNPFWVTGSVGFSEPVTIKGVSNIQGNVTASVNGIIAVSSHPAITGTVGFSEAVAIKNVVPVTLAAHVFTTSSIASMPPITGTVGFSEGITVKNTVNVLGFVTASVNGTVTVSSHPPVTGTIGFSEAVAVKSLPSIIVSSVPLTSVQGNVTASVNGTVIVSSHPAVTGTVGFSEGVAVKSLPSIVVSSAPLTNVQGNLTASVNGTVLLGAGVAAIGSVTVSNAVTVASGSVTGIIVGGQALSSINPLPMKDIRTSVGTVVALTASVTSQTLRSANAARIGMIVYNDSPATAFVKFGSPVASNDWSLKLYADDCQEVPTWWTGIIDIIWTSATGSARVTEA